MLHPDHNASPFNAVPPVVALPALAILAVELVFQGAARGLLGGAEGVGWRLEAIRGFGFFDPLWEHMLLTGYVGQGALWRPVTYGFLHLGLVDAAFAAVLLLAIGNQVARTFPPAAIAAVLLLASVAGAIGYGVAFDTQAPLVGAWPAVYGMLGLFTWALWVAARRTGRNPWTAFQLVGLLVLLQIVFWLGFGARPNLVSELAGFLVAFGLAPLLLPGGLRRVRDLLRQR